MFLSNEQHSDSFNETQSGFSLIELSLVLVIVALIVGGVLVGKNLIEAAEIRAQITQIQQYNLAVNAFKVKYSYLPGDIPNNVAKAYGFAVNRSAAPGAGNGDGFISGGGSGGSYDIASVQQSNGEPLYFWNDLAKASLIEGGFDNAPIGPWSGAQRDINQLYRYMPKAKIGGNEHYIGVIPFSKSYQPYFVIAGTSGLDNYNTTGNYFGLLGVGYSNGVTDGNNNTIPVSKAYSIDAKIDDGLPETGSVKAWWYRPTRPAYGTSALARTPTSCYDNNNAVGKVRKYSVVNGDSKNCGLIIKLN